MGSAGAATAEATPDAGTAPRGLTSAEVAQSVAEGRTNAYEEKTSRSALDIVRANVLTIFNAILGVALVVILAVGSWQDALFGFVLLLNTLTGTVSEIRAKRALDRLAVLDQPVAHVLRDGAESDVPVAEVVLDDVLRLRSGEQVPADAEVLDSTGLEVDESILTGESDPVRPHAGDRVMSGTTVTAGTALVRATAVGAEAYAHRLATEARRYSVVTSELQDGTNRVLRWISWVIVPVALLLVWSQMRQAGGWEAAWSSGAWRTALVAGIAGVVGMVPQGLVLLTSVNFATASLKLARQRVLVQELPAVEVLARVTTLCLDKTGTITTGGITLREVRDAAGAVVLDARAGTSQDGGAAPGSGSAAADGAARVAPEAHRLLGALAALTGGEDPNATAAAIAAGLSAVGPSGEADRIEAPTVRSAVPFSSKRKWSAVTCEEDCWVMGAPEIVLASATGGSELLGTVHALADGGTRVVAVARASAAGGEPGAPMAVGNNGAAAAGPGGSPAEPVLPERLEAAGLVVLAEQVRPDAPQTLGYFREQGVEVKVISGDNPTTVAAVARSAGVTAPDGGELVALDARELPTDVAEPAELERLADALEGAQVLGRVTPEQKRAVVKALQSRGRTVAMTGDGVNDSLALKDADLGIAMGNGAPATKAVARLVLLSGEFAALPGVVAEGRRVMANTERIASLFLSKTVYASLIAVIVSMTAIAYPFLPRQLTIVSSLTIGIPAFILALAPNHRRYRSGFLSRVLTTAVPAGIIAGLTTLAARTWLVATSAPSAQVTTGSTLVLVACGLALLTLTARPLLGWRLGLILVMGGCAVLGVLVPAVRSFFLLAWPTGSTWLVIAMAGAVAVAGIAGVGLWGSVRRGRR